ncbi:O-antigen ligase family protein [Aerococcus urinaeequi]|uniref:O-antigen ligase family protein n=1 Tax=Aerococcus urinaeequi TaxID=51665 RepID=UPI003AAD3ABB
MDNNININQTLLSSKEYKNGVILGLLVSSDLIIKLINLILPVENILVFYYFILIVIFFFINNIVFQTKYLLFYIFFNAYFIISFFRNPGNIYTNQFYIYFNAFYLAAGIFQFPSDYRTVFNVINKSNFLFTLYLIILVIPGYRAGTIDPNLSMGYSYTAIIGIAALLYSMGIFEFKYKRYTKIVYSICVVIEIYFLLFISYNRGALLALGLLVFFLILSLIKSVGKRVIFTIFSGGILYYFSQYYILFFEKVYLFTSNLGIESQSLLRIVQSVKYGSFTSGRDDLYQSAIELFLESPIIGNGIGNFSKVHGGMWPHNIFLEILTDQGVIILLAFIIFLLYFFHNLIFKNNNNLHFHFGTFLFVISIPQLLISSSFWMNSSFWMFIIIFLIKPTKESEELDKSII